MPSICRECGFCHCHTCAAENDEPCQWTEADCWSACAADTPARDPRPARHSLLVARGGTTQARALQERFEPSHELLKCGHLPLQRSNPRAQLVAQGLKVGAHFGGESAG